MQLIDIFIILLALSSAYRGYQIGFVRQAFSTVGFIGGLFAGSALSNFVFSHFAISINKSLVSLITILLASFILMAVGEIAGIRLQAKFTNRVAHSIDGVFGSVMSLVTLVITVWLAAALLLLAPAGPLQQAARDSRIISAINRNLPPANRFLSALNKFIDPNGFPQVFTGREPSPEATNQLPPDSAFAGVLAKARPAIVKIEGYGCGGIVEGSGWVAGNGRIVTNAHVVAGVHNPKVLDETGTHNATVVLFDKNNDLAILSTSTATAPLPISYDTLGKGTGVLVAGYPGGGDFSAQTAAIIDHFIALGRDIYGQGTTERTVYSLQAHVVQGNSGGPVINQAGQVVGIVFATSTTYNNVGYALTTAQVKGELQRVASYAQPVATGQCSQ